MNLISDIAKRLTTVYEPQEAHAVARTLLEDGFDLCQTDILMGKDSEFSAKQRTRLEKCVARLLQGEPVQYVTGRAWFLNRCFRVGPGCLIPRPETEDLVKNIIATETGETSLHVLDIGTGSGCIAVSLALELGEKTMVEAWEVSPQALRIAQSNAALLGPKVSFRQCDVLAETSSTLSAVVGAASFDLIVSNPPYVRQLEKNAMHANVLKHEPHLALFVPDDNPLLFYRAIALLALRLLCHGGRLYFECNRHTIEQAAEMLDEMGFSNIRFITDRFGVRRHLTAIHP